VASVNRLVARSVAFPVFRSFRGLDRDGHQLAISCPATFFFFSVFTQQMFSIRHVKSDIFLKIFSLLC
jgi:hypothetical protein